MTVKTGLKLLSFHYVVAVVFTFIQPFALKITIIRMMSDLDLCNSQLLHYPAFKAVNSLVITVPHCTNISALSTLSTIYNTPPQESHICCVSWMMLHRAGKVLKEITL